MTPPQGHDNTASVKNAILNRRSCKDFTDQPIADDQLRELLELTTAAPSSYNLQPWRIVLVQEAATKEELQKACYGQRQIGVAPVNFVYAVSLSSWREDFPRIIDQGVKSGAWNPGAADYFRKGIPQFQESLEAQNQIREFAIKDAMIAATHTALAAHAMGLSSCFMNGWVEDSVKTVIGAEGNDDIAIALVMPIGFAKDSPQNPGRLDLTHSVFQENLKQPFAP